MDQDEQELIENIAKNIKAERLKAGLSQNDLSKLLGVTSRYIQRIESHPKNLSIKSLVKISKALGVEVTKLLGGNPELNFITKNDQETLQKTINILQGICSR